MDYAIEQVATERELHAALALDARVFGLPSAHSSPAYSREKWLERMKDGFGDLLLCAVSDGETVGIAFGRVEDGESVTVGPVAVDERCRGRGVARSLMLELERRAFGRGLRRLALGAVESAEGFYEKLGYTGTLLVQSEKHGVDEMLSLNTKYRVVGTRVHDGMVNQVFLHLPAPDREFQRRVEAALPGCGTQMVYGKSINIEVRRVESGDVERALPGVVRVFRDDDAVPWHRRGECLAWMTRRAARGFIITAAYVGERIVGYSEWIETYDRGTKILYLGVMQVDCCLRGRGIGTAMLRDGEDRARRMGATRLRTIPEDDRSRGFYCKNGFVQTDDIYHCVCPAAESAGLPVCGQLAAVTMDVVNSCEFVFGLCQSSGRHMYEVANHNPDDSGFAAVTVHHPGGYLQLRYREGEKSATALYWSEDKPDDRAVSAILARGRAAGFEEIGFYFRSKYLRLFSGCCAARESVEMQREVIL